MKLGIVRGTEEIESEYTTQVSAAHAEIVDMQETLHGVVDRVETLHETEEMDSESVRLALQDVAAMEASLARVWTSLEAAQANIEEHQLAAAVEEAEEGDGVSLW